MKLNGQILFKGAVIALIIILGIIIAYSFAKNSIDKKTISKLEQQVVTKSDIEILEQEAKISNANSINVLKDINEFKSEIKKMEKEYEFNILKNRCIKSQIERKINGLEYQIDYCNDQKNLDKFKIVKYRW